MEMRCEQTADEKLTKNRALVRGVRLLVLHCVFVKGEGSDASSSCIF